MNLEERIIEIENRLSKLERAKSGAQAPRASNNGKMCKPCQTYTMDFVSSVPDPNFGVFGETNDTYKCSTCHFEQKFHEKN